MLFAFSVSGQRGRLNCLTTARTGATTRVDPNLAANDGDATRVKLDEAATGLEGDVSTCFDDNFHTRLVVNLLASLNELGAANLFMAAGVNDQMVITIDLGVTLATYRQVIIAVDFADAVMVHAEKTVVADRFGAIVVGQ